MAREHVDYVQSQQLPWQPCSWEYPGQGVPMKELSRDSKTGASSVLLELPAGWSVAPGALSVDEELFVLSGDLAFGDRSLTKDCYAWTPATAARPALCSAGGAVLIAFFSGKPEPAAAASPPETVFFDAFEMPWSHDGMDPLYAEAGMRWKILLHDAESEDTTMLIMTPPHLHPPEWRGPQECHDCVEEMFLISGDFLSPLGIMSTGAYFWRPPGIQHGPYGSRGGNLTLIRTLGDVLVNNWSEHMVDLNRSPVSEPCVPAAIRERLEPWNPIAY